MKRYYNTNKHIVKYYRFYSILLSLFIALMPFVWWPQASIAYEIPRVWYFLVGIDVLLLLGYPFLRFQILDHSMIKIIGFFFLSTVLASIFGANLAKSVWGNPWRLDGIVTLLHLIVFSLLVACLHKDTKRTIVHLIGYVSLVLSGWVSLLWITLQEGAIGASFGQPNFLAGYLVVTLPFMWLVAKKFPFLLLLPIIALLATGAKAGLAGLVLFYLFMFPKHKKITIALGVAVICSLIFYSFWQAAQYPESMLGESRLRIFTKGILAFWERPILGWGWANFDHAFTAVDWPYPFSQDSYVDKAHATSLEILTTTGIIGFLLYCALLWKLYIRLLKGSQILLWSFLLYVFHTQTNVTSIAEEIIFWLIVGLALHPHEEPTEKMLT